MSDGASARTQQALRGCIAAALVVGLINISLNVLRLAYIVNIAHPILILNMLVLMAIMLVGALNWRRLTVTWVEWLLLATLALVAVTTDYTNRAMADIAVDALRPLLFIGTIITVRSLLDIAAFSVSPLIRRLLVVTVWVTLGAVVGCYAVDIWLVPIYTAFSTIDAIFGLGLLMATGTFAGPLVFWVVLFLSGKRMVYLAGLMVLVWVYRKNKRALVSILLVALGAVIASNYIGPQDVSFIAKTSRAVLFEESVSLTHSAADVASGRRLDEIRDAWAAMTGTLSYVVGEGLGFSYYSSIFFAQSGEAHRNVHFTPLSIFVYYGGIFLLLLGWVMQCTARAAWRLAQDKSNPVLFSYSVFFLASLLFCLSEYSVFVYANFAIACGIILAAAKGKQSVSPTDESV